MSGGGGGGTTNTTATPWSGVQPSLSNFYNTVAGAQGAGQLAPAQNTGQVQGWTPDMYNAYSQALGGSSLATSLASNLAAGNLGGSGNIGAEGLAGLINGQFGGNSGNALQQIGAGNFNINPALAGLNATAGGAGLNPNNSALQGEIQAASQPVVQNFQQAVLPGLLSTFSANGRLGSGANMQAINQASTALGQNLTNLSGTLTGNWMQNALQQQQSAQQSLLGGQLQAGSTLGSLSNAASQSLGGLQGNAVSALPGLSANNLNTSGVYQNYLQSILNSQINQQNYNNQLPLMDLQNLEGLLNPGQVNVNGSSTTSRQNPNIVGNVAGGALGGAAIGSQIGMIGGPMGAGIGAGVGLLAGLI